MNLIIGSHVSFLKEKQLLGCVEEMISYGGNAFMLYTGAPQNVNRMSIDENLTIKAHDLIKKNNIDQNHLFVHAPYIINLANPSNQSFAINFLKQEIKRCEQLKIKHLIVHPGNHLGLGLEKGIEIIIDTLNKIITPNQKVIICLETMSGKGSECGYNFEQLKQIIDGVNEKDKIAICLDTCHLHDGGYDITNFDTILKEIDDIIGLNKIACIHINDSKNERGTKKDRHENIGLGKIGFDTLINIIYHQKTAHIPKILETPYIAFDNKKAYPPYKREIEMIKEKKFNSNLIDDIKNDYQKQIKD